LTLIGLMIVRNEGWCLRASARAALRWCDGLVILNHASRDDTQDIIEELIREFRGRMCTLRDDDPVWREMEHRQWTLEEARDCGATHCAIIDADEFLTENLIPTIRPMIEGLRPGQVMQPPWITLWRSLDQYRNDASVWSRSFVSMAFRDSPGLCWKLRNMPAAEGAAVNDYDHHQRHPLNSSYIKPWENISAGGLMHLQHASWRRVRAKQAWYRCVEMIRWPQFGAAAIEARYRPTTDESNIHLSALPEGFWGPERIYLDLDRKPWQEEEVKRMVAQEGAGRFAGLDLQGVA
jgi:Glycosyl transferase family 2